MNITVVVKEVLNFDIVFNKGEKSGSSYITCTRDLGTKSNPFYFYSFMLGHTQLSSSVFGLRPEF